MVLEQIFKLQWIEKKEHAFTLGFIYSVIGLISARLIFPSSMGLMSVAFTSIMLIPSLNTLLKLEENVEIRENKLSIKQLFKDHKDIFKVYIFTFLGIFLAYGLFSLFFPQSVPQMFSSQLNAAGIRGFAAFSGHLLSIIKNNITIFSVCFILSLAYGAGAILFLTWNASVWGIVFGYFAPHSAGTNLIAGFAYSLIPFLPHMTTEALAYISSAIAGGVVSKAVLREKLNSKKFRYILTDALIFLVLGLILVVIAGILEVEVFPRIIR